MKNHRGRPQLNCIQQLIKNQGCGSYVQMKRKADNREKLKRWQQTNPQIETIEK